MNETLSQLILNTLRSYQKDDQMLSKKNKKYVPISTAELEERIVSSTLGIKELGMRPGDKLLLLAENGPDWVIIDFAVLCQGGITVPVYTSLTPEQIKYIATDAGVKFIACSHAHLMDKVKSILSELPLVQGLISFYEDEDPEVHSLESLQSAARKVPAASKSFEQLALSVKPENIASVIYTSGTTGTPKGVMLTHANFISNIETLAKLFPYSEKHRLLSFLPLSHVLERMCTFSFLSRGVTIAYAENVGTIAKNLIEIKPHIMVSVPRVFEKIYARIMDGILKSSPVKRKMFFWAMEVGKTYGSKKLKKRRIPVGLKLKHGLAHKMVYSKILEKTGGNIWFFVSGGAPLPKDIGEFFHAVGLNVFEGYGLTETSPVLACNYFDHVKFGTVGPPLPGIEIKIAEDAEILARGPNVMKGYLNKEAETREVLKDGWFHTGDIGYLDEEGFLVITDRKKDIIITTGGKNIAPQQIENLIKTSPYIDNAVVVGADRKYISSLIIPNFEKLREYAAFSNIEYQDQKELTKNADIINMVRAEINRLTPHLASYERIKRITILERDFEESEGEITPTMKVKRNIIEQKYASVINSMYSE